MHLTLGRSRADGGPRREIRDVLRNLGIQELRAGRQAEIVQLEEELPGEAQPFVDVEAFIEIRIVDQPFPSHRRARLLEIRAHDDHELVGEAIRDLPQALSVIHRRVCIVDRARSNDDDEARVVTVNHVRNGRAGIRHHVRRALGDRDLLEQDRRWDERTHVPNAKVVCSLVHR